MRPPSAWKNTLRSCSRSTPVRRLSTPKTTPVPRPTTFAASPVGARNTRSARPSKNPVSRSGASRKSSALRDGGVSSTSTSKSPERSQVVELGHRGELLRARDGAGELLVDAVGEDLVAGGLVGCEALDELVERALGVEHHRPQLAADLDAVAGQPRRGRRALGSLPSSSRPSALASRLAGSMVTTATRLPCTASPSASAADVVVFPTPPEPAQIRRACPERSASPFHHSARSSSADRASSPGRSSGPSKQKGQRRDRRAARGGAGAAAGRAASGPDRGRAARRGSRPRPARPARRPAPPPRRSRSGRAAARWRRPGRRSRPASSRRALSSSSVSLTGISSGRATATTPVRAGSESISSIVRLCRAMRPTRATPREGARRRQHGHAVARSPGASRMTRS